MEIMELELFKDEMDGDLGIIKELAAQFMLSLNSQVPQIKGYIRDRDFKEIAREAHSIKGGSRNLMAPALENAAVSLEQAAHKKDGEGVNQHLNSLISEIKKFENFIANNLG